MSVLGHDRSKIILESLKVATRGSLGPDVEQRIRVMPIEDEIAFLANQSRYEISTYVYAQHIADEVDTDTRTVSFQVPATPWSHFKGVHRDAWWLRWWVRRRPPQFTVLAETVRLRTRWKGYAAFPDSAMGEVARDPRLGHPVYWSWSVREE